MAELTKPILPGYGTPFLSIFDRDGNLVLDKITAEDGTSKPLAISDFSYTFNETEDDKGTINLWSNSPDLFDNIPLQHYGVLYIQWGYLNGDMRPKLRVLIRNFKEKYSPDGYRLTLEISDNYAPAKNSKSIVKAKLEEVLDYLSGVTDSDAAAKVEAFLNPIPQYRPNTINPAEKRGDNDEEATGLDLPLNPKAPDPITGEYSNTPHPITGLAEAAKNPPTRTGSEFERSTIRFYESLGYPKGYLPPDYIEPEIKEGKPITKPATQAEGSNPQNLVQDMVDKVSTEPTQVTGSDGKIKIFKRRKVSLFPPITEYTFKGGDGRLLEFDYDSDSSYDDDESVLQTIGMNPETGALEVTAYANSVRKLEDAFTPTQYEQIKFENKAYEAYLDYILAGGRLNLDPNKPMEEAVSKPMLIQNSTEMMANGGMLAARDATAMVTTFHAMPISYQEEMKETIENELKNLKADEGFRVRATAKTLGDPAIDGGVNILIKGLSKKRTGTYHITSCTHSIGTGGYTNSYEMYRVSDVPINIDTISSSTTTEKLTEEVKAKNAKILSQKLQALYDQQGYLLPGQVDTSDYYQQMDKLDKEWVKKVGYTDYRLTYRENTGRWDKHIVIRVPNDPRSGIAPPLNSVFTQGILLKIIPNANITKWDISVVNQSKRLQ